MNTEIKIATRASPLAIKQCEILINLIPHIKTKIIKIESKGDQVQDRSLHEIGGKGLFVKSLEKALLENKADIAVHSMKDMEWKQARGLKTGAVLKRGSRKDLLIGKWKSFYDLPKNAKLGTSSVRRKAFLLSKRPDLSITLLRGNINTRITKLNKGEFDAIILAQAGIQRLNLNIQSIELPEDILLPSAGQGAIAIQYKSENEFIKNLLNNVNHEITEYETLAERSFVAHLNGSCSSPIGASATIINNKVFLQGALSSPNGGYIIKDEISGFYQDAQNIGKVLANSIIQKKGKNFPNE